MTDMWQMPPSESLESPTFTLTQHGVLAHLPVIDISESNCIIALIAGDAHEAYGLNLIRCLEPENHRRALYHTLDPWNRLVHCTPDSISPGTKPVWKDVYIAHIPPFRSRQLEDHHLPLSLRYLNTGLSSPFWVPEHILSSLFGAVLDKVSTIPFGWTGSPPLALQLSIITDRGYRKEKTVQVVVIIGRCASANTQWATAGLLAQTAGDVTTLLTRGRLLDVDPAPVVDAHACESDHIVHWPERDGRREKTFYMTKNRSGDAMGIILRFSPCLMAREVLMMDMEVYDDALVRARAIY